jgi:hypothetical protein
VISFGLNLGIDNFPLQDKISLNGGGRLIGAVDTEKRKQYNFPPKIIKI